ncbi:lipooligosaccharide outer core biosynthesis glycosyltransferase GtrOC6 [Acinetobacter nosocomialis]|uniref:lipooligosaccharide outer core biosynthesis glycosyltransferase GtrOC6 n=1 Tax=Acinetobacter nosocomialis TaxID=106654 RepID=UPI001FD6453A|nr:lipooligosaccharide outer core biosynthesis glycosyltransferase GtrOC6 [Acinetobacter nosocomialis]
MIKQKNIIIGSATGYQADLISSFVRSLEKSDFDGVLVLIIYQEQLAEFVTAFSHIKKFKIDFKISTIGKFKSKSKYSGIYKFKFFKNILKRIISLTVNEENSASKIKALKITGYPHVSRFFEYKEIVESHPDASHVLLSDVRDVFFQSNPFKNLGKGLLVGMENPAFTIGTEQYNQKWILDAYGENFYNLAKDEQVSCSGVTIGDYESINVYINKMIEEFCKQPYQKMSERIYDQAMHNKLLITNELANAIRCQPFESIIVTLGLYPIDQIAVNDQGFIINRKQEIIPIVHQHDRHPELLQLCENYIGK